MKVKNDPLTLNQVEIPILTFMESYNKGIPSSFPRVSVTILKEFQIMHPTLFKNNDAWSIDKHRKKLMDWLPSYKETKITFAAA